MTPGLLLALGLGTLASALLAGATAHLLAPSVKLNFPTHQPVKPTALSQKILMAGLLPCLAWIALGDYFQGLVFTGFFLLAWSVGTRGKDWRARFEAGRKLEKMRDLFPPTLGMAVQALKTGQTMPQVLEYLSRESASPLREELGLVCAEMDMGAPAEQALAKMAERYPDFLELSHFLESYRISRHTGANLTHLLQVLVDGMEEKSRILRKMEAMTAQARLSGLLVGLLPFFLALVFFLLDPTLLQPLFTQKAGWAILLASFLLEAAGFTWIRHLLRLEV